MPISDALQSYRATITRDQAYQALSLAVSIAPNGTIQRAISKEYNSALREDNSYFKALQRMIDIIYNGINYGNWPA